MQTKLLLGSSLIATALGLYLLTLASDDAEKALLCNIFVEAYFDGGANETVVCNPGDQVDLFGDVTGNSFGFRWEPADLLNDPTSQFPTATVFETTTFTLTVTGFDPTAPNLVTNGDFSQGVVGIESSGYSFRVNGSGNQEVFGEGTYSIASGGNQVHPDFRNCSDPDGVTSQMMIVNGAGTVTNVWCQDISVNPGSSYNFSAWVVSMVGSAPAQLQFTINGQQIGSPLAASSGFCDWNQFSGDWTNTFSTAATLCIRNQTTALSGNDFAIDNIQFLESCEETAQATVIVLEDPVLSIDDIGCNDPTDCVQPNVVMADNFDFAEYDWFVTSGSATITSGATTATPTICGAGSLTLSLSRFINGQPCITFHDLTIDSDNAQPPAPVINGVTEFCPGQATFTAVPNAAFVSYAWTFPNGGSANGPTTQESVTANFTAADGNGNVCLTVTNTCGRTRQSCLPYTLGGSATTFRDSVVCEIVGPGSFTDTIPMASGCDQIVVTTLVIELDTLRRTATSCSPLDTGIDTMIVDGGINCDTVVITTTALLPPDTLRSTAFTCMVQDTGVFQSILPGDRGCDTILFTTLVWTIPDTIRMTATTCMAQDTGTFFSTLPGPDGCDTILITGIELSPRVTLYDTTFTCMVQDTGIVTSVIPGVMGCDTTLLTTVLWQRPDTTFATALTCMAQDTGLFQSIIPGPGGCDTILLTQVNWQRPDTTFATALTCMVQDTGLFQSIIPGPDGCDTILLTQVNWQRPDTLRLTMTSCNPLDIGETTETSTDPDGCRTVTITQITLVTVDVGRERVFSCDPTTFGFDTLVIPTATCDSLHIIETYGNPPVSFAAISQEVPCGNGGGVIQITNATGGSGAYTYRLNNGNEQTSATFFDLSVGNYTVVVTDSDGCATEQVIFINDAAEPMVSLGEDRTINWGDSTLVFLQYSGDFIEASSIRYSDGLCQNCQERWFAPLETTTYRVTLTDTLGCVATDQIRINVERPEGVYVPSAFSPNGDGINDAFIVNGNPSIVSSITDLMIFNRWGESIFVVDETAVNHPSGGWDGKHRGQVMNAGVFAYTFVAHYVDGSEERFRGEVVLVR